MIPPRLPLRFALAASFCLAPYMANAAPFDVNDLLTSFNAITLHDMNQNGSETEGRVVVGGNLSAAQANFTNQPNFGVSSPFAAYGGVNVYGTGTVSNANGQTVYYGNGGSAPSGVAVFDNAHTFPNPITDFFSPLAALSLQLSTMTGQVISSLPTNNAVLTSTGYSLIDGTNVAILNVDGSVLAGTTSLDVNPNGADLVIINVNAPGAFTYSFSLSNNFGARTETIWNFYNATSVSVRNWEGAILAPNAVVGGNSALEGTVVADSINTTGEIHWYPLNVPGNFLHTPPPPPPPPPPVPEPMALSLFGIGLAGLRLARRRAA